MERILAMLAEDQDALLLADHNVDMTIVLATGEEITGIIETTHDGVVSIWRLAHDGYSYHDVPRHYSIDAVIGAYYTEGS